MTFDNFWLMHSSLVVTKTCRERDSDAGTVGETNARKVIDCQPYDFS